MRTENKQGVVQYTKTYSETRPRTEPCEHKAKQADVMESHCGLGGEDGCEAMPECAPLQQTDVEGDLLLTRIHARDERQCREFLARNPGWRIRPVGRRTSHSTTCTNTGTARVWRQIQSQSTNRQGRVFDAKVVTHSPFDAAEGEADRLHTTTVNMASTRSRIRTERRPVSKPALAYRVPGLRLLLDEVVDGVAQLGVGARVGCFKCAMDLNVSIQQGVVKDAGLRLWEIIPSGK